MHPVLYRKQSNAMLKEKECLAFVFAYERFDHYIYGKDHITVQSDHKPLEIIFKKSLLSAPKRLQRMLLRLQKYNLDVVYTRGKELYIADTLSRATPEYHGQHPSKLAEEIAQIQHAEWVRKITDSRLNQIRDLTNKDDNLQSLKTVILSGWPDTKDDEPIAIRPTGTSKTPSQYKMVSSTTAAVLSFRKPFDLKCFDVHTQAI